MNVEQALALVEEDRAYYEASGGGVTLSGGEPLIWPRFVAELLELLTARGISVAIETCGAVRWEIFDRILDQLDLVLFDVKVADPTAHQQILGGDARLIFGNLARLLKRRREDVIVRIPLIPGFTATEENIAGLAQRLRPLAPPRVTLLPYHPMGQGKARAIGDLPDPSLPHTSMPRSKALAFRHYFDWTKADVP